MMPLLQTILVARNNRQSGSWKQLLPIIAIAAVYGIKTLIKAKKSFTEEQESDEPPIRKPALAMAQQYQEHVPKSVKTKTAPKPESVRITPLISSKRVQPLPQEQEQLDTALELDLDDTDALRRAIIYSEILGKPVAMR
jgi:hypothetical protein